MAYSHYNETEAKYHYNDMLNMNTVKFLCSNIEIYLCVTELTTLIATLCNNTLTTMKT